MQIYNQGGFVAPLLNQYKNIQNYETRKGK